MEHYSAVKQKEILPFVTARMDLESIMPSEISQRKANAIWFHSYVESNGQHKLTNKTEPDS